MILVLNAGSSSLKFALFRDDGDAEIARGVMNHGRGADEIPDLVLKIRDDLVARKLLSSPTDIHAIGQRVVHGGTSFRASVLINSEVLGAIEKLSSLAPLHNPPALKSIAGAAHAFPNVDQVAVFDTAFYVEMETRRFVYPLPFDWFKDWGVRRFGFHGISHSYIARRSSDLLKRQDLRLISCHLGNGCSITATLSGTAVATSMGFTPLEGVMMGSRSGSVDPGILLWVQKEHGVTVERLESVLNHESGLLGVSGISHDLRLVEKAAAEGHERSALALEMFTDRVKEAIGAMAAVLGGIDALAFTAGIGENSASIRNTICQGLDFLGINLDPTRNQSRETDRLISSVSSKTQVFVIRTDEERSIANETAHLTRS